MSDVPPAPVRTGRWFRGTRRAEGLASTGRRYVLTVAALSSLATVPTLVAVALGAASLHNGSQGRSPFVIPVGPHVVVLPDPDRTPPERRRTPRETGPGPPAVGLLVGAAVAQPAPNSPVRLGWPESEFPAAPTAPKQRPDKQVVGKQFGGGQGFGKRVVKRTPAQVPGRSIAGWSRPAGPRR